ncbi:acylneuraminate cytidylyltransferase [Aeromicrobium ginsengisoli]|uniref:N-acylneuraminate cytidylyltransferase n=1 Tax=Aeromicrobium ginsengisoli TaxID=363867 RepID=A0A5M4FDH1_9ACTN|nr:acylneuraminate cytidylyltransferase [Aeromicrobium ginsengisoli]KAA1397240.1 acylneuraminate cytidylyltransferase [Aeromicrobium ginsengisoli]
MSQDLAPAPTFVSTRPPAGVWVVIPARGGSKGVRRKNLRPVGGEPLVERAVRAVLAVSQVDDVYVSTDDSEIADVSMRAGARVVHRPARISGDEASSESAVSHLLAEMAEVAPLPGVIVLVQATSPFIEPADLGRAIDLVRSGECDVAFSATRADLHLWREGPAGPEGVNHDARRRQRRQDRPVEHRETGAFYVMRTDGFLEHGHRFFGRIRLVEVEPLGSLEIDTEADLRLAELVHLARQSEAIGSSPIPARAVVTDFDGVHTDDRVLVDQHGVESVTVSRSDGMGIALLRRAGIPLLILSAETNPVVAARAAKLGVEVIAGCHDKLAALTAWAAARAIALDDVAYLGNDVNDVECLTAVGWPVVVADARPEVHASAPIVLRHGGGAGAIRELANRVLTSPPHHDSTTEKGLDHG